MFAGIPNGLVIARIGPRWLRRWRRSRRRGGRRRYRRWWRGGRRYRCRWRSRRRCRGGRRRCRRCGRWRCRRRWSRGLLGCRGLRCRRLGRLRVGRGHDRANEGLRPLAWQNQGRCHAPDNNLQNLPAIMMMHVAHENRPPPRLNCPTCPDVGNLRHAIGPVTFSGAQCRCHRGTSTRKNRSTPYRGEPATVLSAKVCGSTPTAPGTRGSTLRTAGAWPRAPIARRPPGWPFWAPGAP